MRIAASDEAIDLIRHDGGRVYVWVRPLPAARVNVVETSTNEPSGPQTFDRVEGPEVELYLATGSLAPPDELELEVRGLLHRRVTAYWNGCAYAGLAA